MQCPACQYEPTQQEAVDSPDQCPSCGRFYAKALAAMQRRETEAPKVEVLPMHIAEPPKASGFSAAPAHGSNQKGRKVWQVVAGVVALAAAAYVVAVPYITVHQIRNAVQSQDVEDLDEYIDFPKVRESMKEQLNTMVLAKMQPEMNGNPFAALGAAFAGVMIDKMVSVMVTPSGMAQLMEGKRPTASEGGGSDQSGTSSSREKGAFARASYAYEGINKFVIAVPGKQNKAPVRLILRRDLIAWRLSDIRLPMDQ